MYKCINVFCYKYKCEWYVYELNEIFVLWGRLLVIKVEYDFKYNICLFNNVSNYGLKDFFF